jgi:hypothetical protein
MPAAAASAPTAAPAQPPLTPGEVDAMLDTAGEILMSTQEKRYPEARRLLEKAAPAERPEGLSNLATMLYLGMGGPADPARASKLRHRAAELGSISAKMTLVGFYQEGDQLHPRDPQRAYKLAMELSETVAKSDGERELIALAQWRVAMMLLQGSGVAKDPVAAYRWTSRSSELGHPDAMISRAVMLATGDGVAEDDAAARLWYRRAVDLQVDASKHALRSLGGMLLIGEGGPRDRPRGFGYLLFAAALGDEHAPTILDAFKDELSEAERKQAIAISNEALEKWRAR